MTDDVLTDDIDTLDLLWQRIATIRSLYFDAKSTSATGWTGRGKGQVIVSQPSDDALGFEESGLFTPGRGEPFVFHNVYRWTRNADTSPLIQLEHLRFGVNHPVLLFDLAPETPTLWRSTAPHVCGDDRYTARLDIEPDHLRLTWIIKGPAKAESLVYRYES
ncbi:MAG: DUF6314 family protein [Bacteroidota bacterium]